MADRKPTKGVRGTVKKPKTPVSKPYGTEPVEGQPTENPETPVENR